MNINLESGEKNKGGIVFWGGGGPNLMSKIHHAVGVHRTINV